jgi:hypothetical protein
MPALRLLPLVLVCAACGSSTPTVAECSDEATLHVCDADGCRDQACRGDEVCAQAACRPWQDTPLSADFDLAADPRDPLRVVATVRPGGFPRAFTEQIRFTFGDGIAGWSEKISHRYKTPGVYVVDLEVRLDGYRLLRASRPFTAGTPPPDWTPAELTVNAIPVFMNGSVPYRSNNDTPGDPSDDYDRPFTLLLPDRGFSVDVTFRELDGAPVKKDALTLTSDCALGGGAVAAGANLAGRLVYDQGPSLHAYRASWTVADADAFPAPRCTLTLAGEDAQGRRFTSAVPFQVTPLTAQDEPFSAPYQWLLRFDMDLYTVTGSTDARGMVQLEATPGADGEPDFLQELRLLGVQGSESAPGAKTVAANGFTGANAVYLALVEAEIMREIRLLYHMAPDGSARDGIAFELHATGWPGAPDPAQFKEDGDFSMIRLGGELPGYFGMSMLSYFAQRKIDDTAWDLGIGTVAITRALFGTTVLSEAFADIKPGVGAPAGEHPLDATVLSGTFDRWAPGNTGEANARWDALHRIARFLGMAIGAVTAHEMGHAMGLVPDGVPPEGLFADVHDCPFIGPRTDGAHADYPGLNLMQAGGQIITVIGEFTATTELPPGLGVIDLGQLALAEERLAPYERAYFRRMLSFRR